MLDKIQDAIVEERNNFGDFSVCGDDLRLAAAAAILLYLQSTDTERREIEREAGKFREELQGDCPSLGLKTPE